MPNSTFLTAWPAKASSPGAVQYRLITPDYFRVMKIAVRQGRQFDQNDTVGAEPVVIVNEAFAHRNFAGAEALGQQLCIGCEKLDPAMRRVVGVVNDTKQRSLGEASPATVFIPLTQAPAETRAYCDSQALSCARLAIRCCLALQSEARCASSI